MQDNIPHRIPSVWLAFVPLVFLIVLLALSIYLFGSDALGGGSQVCLLMASGVCVLIGMGVLRKSWGEFEETPY